MSIRKQILMAAILPFAFATALAHAETDETYADDTAIQESNAIMESDDSSENVSSYSDENASGIEEDAWMDGSTSSSMSEEETNEDEMTDEDIEPAADNPSNATNTGMGMSSPGYPGWTTDTVYTGSEVPEDSDDEDASTGSSITGTTSTGSMVEEMPSGNIDRDTGDSPGTSPLPISAPAQPTANTMEELVEEEYGKIDEIKYQLDTDVLAARLDAQMKIMSIARDPSIPETEKDSKMQDILDAHEWEMDQFKSVAETQILEIRESYKKMRSRLFSDEWHKTHPLRLP